MPEQGLFRLADYAGTIREVMDSGGEFTLYPRGTSMLPLIVQGRDSVTLVKAEEFRTGDIAFYQRENGQYVLHRVIAADGETYTVLYVLLWRSLFIRRVYFKLRRVFHGEK